MFQDPISRYCFIPATSHIEEITIIAPKSAARTSPNSFSISRIAKKDGCCNKNTERPIAIGANTNAEIETPRSVFLIWISVR